MSTLFIYIFFSKLAYLYYGPILLVKRFWFFKMTISSIELCIYCSFLELISLIGLISSLISLFKKFALIIDRIHIQVFSMVLISLIIRYSSLFLSQQIFSRILIQVWMLLILSKFILILFFILWYFTWRNLTTHLRWWILKFWWVRVLLRNSFWC